MRQITIDQKLNEKPQPVTARVQTDNPTPMSLNGFTLQNMIIHILEITKK
jgi:hypothetical protein